MVVIAGDVGGRSPVVQSYELLADNVHALTSGMGQHADVGTYLVVDVDPRGVRFVVRHLGGRSGQPAGVLSVPAERFPFRVDLPSSDATD